jgi:small subunit ribosomal protein S24e
MALKIISEKNNELLKRKDLVLEVDYTGATPSKKEIKKQISSKINVDEKLIILKIVKGKYGTQKVKVSAIAYNSDKDMREIERLPEEKTEETKTEENKGE